MDSRPKDSAYVAAAQHLHRGSGLLSVETGAPVRLATNGGAYVQAWLWVTDEAAQRHAQSAPTPGYFTPDVAGPWVVDSVGRTWIIRNLNTARQKIVGPVSHPRSRSKINYFDRALALANQRNIEARKSFTQ